MVDRPHPANLSWWKRLRTFCLRPHQERNRQTADREAVPPHRSFRRWCERPFDARRPCIESRDWAVKRTVHPLQRRTVASTDCQLGTTSHSLLRTMDGFFLQGQRQCACGHDIWTVVTCRWRMAAKAMRKRGLVKMPGNGLALSRWRHVSPRFLWICSVFECISLLACS